MTNTTLQRPLNNTHPTTNQIRLRRFSWRQTAFVSARYLAILLVVILLIFPFVWMLLSSFKNQIDITTSDNLLSFTPTLRNYQNVFEQHNYLQYLLNSFIVAAVSTQLSLILGLPAAYGIARFRFGWLGIVLLTARIIPGITFLIPWYIVFGKIGLLGTYWALILSHMLVGLPFIVWIMIPFFESLPRELEEAALIDGSSVFKAFFHIALPLSVPGMIASGIISFIFSWNNFMFSLVLAGDDTRTLPIAIFNFISYSSVDWGGLMAAAVVITVPVLIITLFVQRYIVDGLTAGATKG
ncbi:MAG: carbohydrate ABC transporter permease [Anaerolineae bacterium]|nr:carbohydrate ABC transporter permease [Anaerolineae bacterium]